MFKLTKCWFLPHKWEELELSPLNVKMAGGPIARRVCSNCGKVQHAWSNGVDAEWIDEVIPENRYW